jgi:predicted dehydrogenase
MPTQTRRQFARNLAAAGAVTALSSSRVLGANNRIRLGFIGLGNRGDQVLDAFLPHKDADIVALCDLNQDYTRWAASKTRGITPQQTTRYQDLLDRKDIDAVVISTPDHWHALQTIHACQAEKDVYVEKPLSLRIHEGSAMVKAVRKYQRICQVGIHRRSIPVCREAADLVRTGAIGKVTAARAFHIQNEWPLGIDNPPDTTPPADFNWDAWLGPAPQVPYNPNRTFYRFRWFYDYSGGQVTNFGVHYLDFIHWALDTNAPSRVTALGGKFSGMQDNREIPDTLEAIWEYPGNTLVTFSQFNATAAPWSLPGCEVELRGTLGTLYLFGNGYQIIPDNLPAVPFPARTPIDRPDGNRYSQGRKDRIEPRENRGSSTADTTHHTRNFLDCIHSRKDPNCTIETGHRSTSTTLLANIAHQTRSVIEWDAQQEQITNSQEANNLLHYAYRPPYQLPTI